MEEGDAVRHVYWVLSYAFRKCKSGKKSSVMHEDKIGTDIAEERYGSI